MGNSLEGKSAVVTGAGRGIGRGIAIAMAQEGAQVVVNDLGGETDGTGASKSPADEVVKEITDHGGKAVANYGSVAVFTDAENMINSAVENFGKIDILVNVAGNDRGRMIYNLTEEDWDAVIAVHLKGTFSTMKFASALMRKQRSGRIINCTSAAGLIGDTGHSNYCAAKAGIAGLTRAGARELGRYGITVNSFMPAASTRMAALVTEEIIKKREAEGQALPGIVWPLPDPDDVGPVVAYLATDEASDINGQIFGVIGGRVFLYSHPDEIKTIYKDGRWTVEELTKFVPQTLTAGLVNPAPRKDK
ncbi:MAG: SDR family oxidoreductase [Spirochaetota bacterium]|nr:SDR family oxidoreductase [Spirochaetota bacterium]